MDEDLVECDNCGEESPADEWCHPDWPTDIPDFDPSDYIQCPRCLASRRGSL